MPPIFVRGLMMFSTSAPAVNNLAPRNAATMTPRLMRPFVIQHDAGYDLAPEGGQVVLADWLRHLLPISNSRYA